MSNYYIALGMEKEGDIKKIKKAYGIWCRKHDSDVYPCLDQKDSSPENKEAPETLSYKEKRKNYNQYFEQKQFNAPLYLNTAQNQKLFRERQIRTYSSIIDDFFEGFVPGFFDYGFSQHKELYLELILSSEEAQKGGDFTVKVPVLHACTQCHGTGMSESSVCKNCCGFGQICGARSFVLHVPARVKHGARAKVSLEGIGLKAVFLNLEIIMQ